MTKPCIYCNQEIELVKTAQGWRPFNPHTLEMHDCPEGKAARAAKKAQGGGGHPPKDEKMIAKEVCMKIASERLAPSCGTYLDDIALIVQGYRLLRDAILEDQEKEKNN